MAEEKVETGHPLDRQNALEREIILEGSKDPDNYEMPDGRTLTEVRNDLRGRQDKEFQEEIQMIARRTREQSIPEFQKGGEHGKLVMTPSGSIVDVTEPVPSEETITMATSRTTQAEIDTGIIQPPRERGESHATLGEASLTGTAAGSAAPTPSTPSAPTTSTPSAPPMSSGPSTSGLGTGESSPGSSAPSK